MRLRPHGTDSGALSRSRNRLVNPLDAPPHPQKSFYLTPRSTPMQYQVIILAFRYLLASFGRGAAARPRWFYSELVLTGPLPGGIWRLVGKKATYERVCFARAAAVRCSACKCNGAAQLVSGTSSIRLPCAPCAPALVDQAVAALILPSNNIELAGGIHLPC